ncbi:hypothetical protein [Halarcobacter sp.]|uniref:hypothetical protein n=1 Tax=Halarcobacter sp. TaxID=2321133 RepID=UPI002AAB669A|nr:hypothetical protein [Halarcobacter sp.]
MEYIVTIITLVAVLASCIIAFWSYKNTRNTYFKEYINKQTNLNKQLEDLKKQRQNIDSQIEKLTKDIKINQNDIRGSND